MLLHEESSINSTQPLPHHHPANPRSLFFLPQPHAKLFSPSCHVLASWEQWLPLTEKTTIPQNASGKHEKHLILYRLEAIPGPRALIPLPQSQRAGKVRVLCRNNHFPHQTNTLTKQNTQAMVSEKPRCSPHSTERRNRAQCSRNQKNTNNPHGWHL